MIRNIANPLLASVLLDIFATKTVPFLQKPLKPREWPQQTAKASDTASTSQVLDDQNG